MTNPIPHSGLFTSPTLEEIQGYIEGMPAKDKAICYQIFMFTLNSCHKLVEESKEPA